MFHDMFSIFHDMFHDMMTMMMTFMYTYTKTIKEADTHKLERPPERVDEGTSKEYEL